MEKSVLQEKEAQISRQGAILDAFFRHAVTPLVILDKDFNFIRVNEAYARACSREPEDFLGKNHFELYPSDARAIFAEVAAAKKPYRTTIRPYILPDHPKRGLTYWDWTLVPLLDQQGEVEFLLFSLTDATARRCAELELHRVNRALRTQSAGNQAVVRAGTEAELLQNVCRAVVEEGGYRLAWIGYAENDRQKTVRPMAQAGYEEGYLETLKITWADKKRGRGPTGTAIRTGKPALARNILTDPDFAPWRQEASKRGYASSLVLPLAADGRSFGALNIYAGEADAFDTEEVQLLSELAGNVSFGILALRGREENRRMAAALRRSFDELEARVQDRTQELGKSNAALQNEIAERLWSEKKLQESEERYRRLVDQSPDAICVQSQSRFLFVNPAAARLFGVEQYRDLVGKAVPAVIHPDYRRFVTEHICQVNAEGARTNLQEIKILGLNGRVVDVEASGVGINYQGQPAVQVMLRDISRRKEMEKALEHQASFPRLNPNPVLEADTAGNIIYANAASFEALAKLGLENQTRAFLPPDLKEIRKTAAKTGESVFYREVEINGAFFGETISFHKEFEAIRIYGRDITRQKRAEMELQESLAKLQVSEEELQATIEELQVQSEELQAQSEELLEANQDLHEAHDALEESQKDLNRAQAVAHTGSWRLDMRRNALLWSDETYRIFGISPGTALTYEAFLAAVHPEDREYVDQQWAAALQGGPYDLEHRIVAGGTVKWVREKAELELDPQGQLLGGFGTVQDITARKEVEETLQVSRDFLEIANSHSEMTPLLLDYVAAVKEHVGCEAAAIRILDERGNIPYEAYTGFSEEFVASESPLCISSDRCLCINVIQGATDPSLPCYTKGSSCYINDFSRVLATTPPGVLGETRNVCHHFGYESVALVPIVFGEKILGLIHLADHRQNMVPLTLMTRLERIALTLGTAINRVQAEEERERLIRELGTERARLQAIIASAPEAIVVADADGRLVMTNPAADQLYAKPLENGADLESCALFQLCQTDGTVCVPGNQPLIRSAKAGETHRNLEMALAWPNGLRRDLLVNTAPIIDRHGGRSGAVGLFQDITRRKRVEEKIRKLNLELSDRIREVSERTRQLEAANKELEAFSYSVSHDLRSPLRAIEGFARILLEEHGEKLAGEGMRLLNVIRSNTRIMGDLIDDLLAFSRLGRQQIRAQKIDMAGLVTSIFGELRARVPERQMQLLMAPLPPAYGDRNLINQVLANLLENAAKFTKSKENPIIEVGGWTEGKEDIYFIKDNGVGFDMRYVDKIFGVFQRLHRREEFEGTGVGLAIVQRIISRHGGRVWAAGKVDDGAMFYFALPHKGEMIVE
ncbi:MAG: PAS domain S-box protein [Desulfobaccales bacterium]